MREHVIRAFTRLVDELGVDGLKIDFIDAASIYAAPGDVVAHGEIAAAATRMLDDLRQATDALGLPRPDLRVPGAVRRTRTRGIRRRDPRGGLPGDFIANRRATIDLRVFDTGQRVHSD